jgi:hypothetical protein
MPLFRIARTILLFGLTLIGVVTFIPTSRAQNAGVPFSPQVPKTWNDVELADLELPLANPKYSPVHVPAEYYYRVPVQPIYKSYPIYAPGREPAGYLENLKKLEPVVLWDDKGTRPPLKTEADWIAAGDIAFTQRVTRYNFTSLAEIQNPAWWQHVSPPLRKDGSIAGLIYIIREKGKIEVGSRSCAECHTRVLPDGTAINGAQGNFPGGRETGWRDLNVAPRNFNEIFGIPWIQSDKLKQLSQMSGAESAKLQNAIPPGVFPRHGTSLLYPVVAPDLIGVKDRKYLDRTGLQRHRAPVDLMRYGALNQGMDFLSRYGDFIPQGKNFRELPDPAIRNRYSDEQLYALALYIYSLKPPPNPNQFDADAKRGQRVFAKEGCAGCHTPPFYTNNKLTPAPGFQIPEGHRERYDILPVSVGTDPTLAMMTRRGTGYYKVPSLRGVWYRGPFEHNGSVATLEDWFDPKRLKSDYVPSGFVGYEVSSRPVKGHEFGLQLSAKDKKALIAFLRTL